jgi:hypothetical protein
VKYFALYTLARLALFVAAFGLLWLVGFHWLQWTYGSVLWTAVLAMLVSGIGSLLWLGPLRDRLSASVHERVSAAQTSVQRHREREDIPDDGQR